MRSKTIVFDLDDTLVKEIDYLKSAFLEIAVFLDSNNKLLFEEMFQWYQNKENVFKNLEERYAKADLQLLLEMYRNHFPSFSPNTEVKQILINLKKQGFFLGLITDGYSVTQRNKIKALELENLFDLIVISEEFGSEKPNSKNYEIFHQFDTEEYYYIGDNVSKDFVTPNKLSWRTICLLDDGENIHKQDFNRESIYLPSVVIKKISELNFTMNNSKIWLSSPHMGGSEQGFVNEAFETNWVAPLGPNVTGFEQDLEGYVGQDSYVAALSSGTGALHLGLILLGVQAGDEVICQSMTFSASANPIMYLGATPIFIDSELDTWNMCPIALEAAVIDRISKGKRPKAIIAVHLYGMPYKVEEIKAISIKYNIPILEDSAEALGSTYKGQKCGTFGDIGILSFNGNKIITTSGGGALVTNSKEVKDKTVFLATQARDNAPHYQHSHVGYNYRMSNICAGIGRGQMQVLDKHVALRRDAHAFYCDFFSKIEAVTVLREPNSDYFSNHWLSAIVLGSYEQREALRLAFEAANIETRPLWKPMHLQPVFAQCAYYGGQVAEDLFEKGLCLPSGSNLTTEEKWRIESVLQRFFA